MGRPSRRWKLRDRGCRASSQLAAACLAAIALYTAHRLVSLGVSGAGRVPSLRRRTNTLPTARRAAFGSPSFGGIALGKIYPKLCSVSLVPLISVHFADWSASERWYIVRHRPAQFPDLITKCVQLITQRVGRIDQVVKVAALDT